MTTPRSHRSPARTWRNSAVALSAGFALILAACGSDSADGSDPDAAGREGAPEETHQVLVAVTSDDFNGSQLAYSLARTEGFFAAEGVEIEEYLTNTAPNALQALINDQAQVGFLSLSTTAQAVEQGRNVKLGAAVQITNNWSLLISTAYLQSEGIDPQEFAARPIEERAEVLQDTIWATNSAGGLWERASWYLADWFGLDPERDVQLTPLEQVNQISGIRDGSIQVWLASPPNNLLLVESGEAVELLSTQELIDNVPAVANARAAEVIINDDWASENVEIAEAFFRAYQQGADFALDSSAEEIIESARTLYPDLDEDRLEAVVTSAQSNLPPDSRHSAEAIEAQIEFALASGNISEPLQVDDVYTDRYLPPAD